jgi:hypothetical protein
VLARSRLRETTRAAFPFLLVNVFVPPLVTRVPAIGTRAASPFFGGVR